MILVLSIPAFRCVQLINILTLGSPNGKGCFFPNGLQGEILTPTGFNESVPAVDNFPAVAQVAGQARTLWLGQASRVPMVAFEIAFACQSDPGWKS